MLVPQESSSALLVMISSKSVSICNRSRARRVNSGKITYGVPLFEANLLAQRHEIWSQKARDSTLSYDKNLEFLSHLNE